MGIKHLYAKRIVEKGILWATEDLPKIKAAAKAAREEAEAHIKDSDECTPLHRAAGAGDLTEVQK